MNPPAKQPSTLYVLTWAFGRFILLPAFIGYLTHPLFGIALFAILCYDSAY